MAKNSRNPKKSGFNCDTKGRVTEAPAYYLPNGKVNPARKAYDAKQAEKKKK